MSTTFGYLKNKLSGIIDILPPSLMEDIINDSLKDIYRENNWGFLTKEDYVRTPEMIFEGSANVTKYSDQVTLDSIASAKLVAVTVNEIPIIERQFRIPAASITGRSFLYKITNVDDSNLNALVLTIDPPFLDKTNSTAKYQILKVYYNPPPTIVNNIPIIDFMNWKYFISLKLQRKLHTETSLEQLNTYDPARFYCDEPRHVVMHPPDDNETPLFELYPAPRFERVYRVIYQRDGLDLTDDNDIVPKTLSSELVLKRCKYRLYEYTLANIHKYPELKGSTGRFQNLMALTMNQNDLAAYPKLLEKAIADNESTYPQAYLGDYMRMPFLDGHIGNLGYENEFSGGQMSSSFVALIDF